MGRTPGSKNKEKGAATTATAEGEQSLFPSEEEGLQPPPGIADFLKLPIEEKRVIAQLEFAKSIFHLADQVGRIASLFVPNGFAHAQQPDNPYYEEPAQEAAPAPQPTPPPPQQAAPPPSQPAQAQPLPPTAPLLMPEVVTPPTLLAAPAARPEVLAHVNKVLDSTVAAAQAQVTAGTAQFPLAVLTGRLAQFSADFKAPGGPFSAEDVDLAVRALPDRVRISGDPPVATLLK
jgi:hypothetical protein